MTHLVTKTSKDGMSCLCTVASTFHRAAIVAFSSVAESLETSAVAAKCCLTAAIHVAGFRVPGRNAAR